ncbi:MAG: TonB-dependent receptor [Hyphomonas sp.]|nr:TonB-dependent receptor [Hyphomonas sp.]
MFLKSIALLLGGTSLAALGAPALAQDADPALQDVIIVTGSRVDNATELRVSPDAAPVFGNDVTLLTARTPGGARIGNGELSGQMQYRGLFGERLNLRVNGQRFASGGPNLMDPVFHYAPAPLVQAVVIDRGVSPVSSGPGLAGGADAVFKRVNYSDNETPSFGYDFSLGGRSVNESLATGGVFGASTQDWRLSLLGSWEEGDDTEFADGTIAGTAFERGVYGLSGGLRTDLGEITLDLRRQNTGPSGNPPFPMDIIYFDTDFARLGYTNTFGAATFEASLHYTDVAHLMNNFSQRPAPPAMRQRATFADATTRGFDASLAFSAFGGDLSIGLDGDVAEHNVTITNPNNLGFFVTPFPQIEIDRSGGFVEWTGVMAGINTELGLRIDQNSFEAGDAITGPALPMGPLNLAAAFNDADTSGEDTILDAVARIWTDPKNGLSWRATLAHKQQMPGYIQRFGWLPINASGGLADGNIYVGDLMLEPETALIAEAGFDYASTNAYLRPTVFLRQIDDYIQGVPFDDTVGVINSPVEMIASMNGDPTPLRWANVDARLYGFDLDAGYDFDGPLRVDGVINVVRGERRDIVDNLYRVAPPNLTLGLTWESAAWSITLEGRAVAEQDKVSRTNSEIETDAYAVVSLYGDWHVGDGVRLSAGVENLFDEIYRDHLSGYNRNGFGDVPVGERIPGAGRGLFLRLSFAN